MVYQCGDCVHNLGDFNSEGCKCELTGKIIDVMAEACKDFDYVEF